MHSPKTQAQKKSADIIAMGFDYGRKHTGIAIGGTLTQNARPLNSASGDWKKQLEFIAELIAEWRPNLLVVGLPRHLDGASHSMTRRAESFARKLSREFNLPIEFADERLTTFIARSEGGNWKDKDALAACQILRSWLNEREKKSSAIAD